MAKLTRQTLTLFGGSGPTADFAQFGSQAASSPITTKNVATIQALTAWVQGWQNAVALRDAPYLEDMNGLLYVLCYELCYGLQQGIPEWDNATTYYTDSVVINPGTLEMYASLIDNNTGNGLPSQVDNSNWKFCGILSDLGLPHFNVRNLAYNGTMNVSQRATSFAAVTNGQYTLDGYKAVFTGSPTLAVSQDTGTTFQGANSLKANLSAVGGATSVYVSQLINSYKELRNQTVSLSVMVNTTLPNVKIAIADGSSTTKSAAHPGDGAWHLLTVSAVVASGATKVELQCGQLDGSIATGIWYVDDFMAVGGQTPARFVPEDAATEFVRCCGTCQERQDNSTTYFPAKGATPTQVQATIHAFCTPMVAQPTVTVLVNSTVLLNGDENQGVAFTSQQSWAFGGNNDLSHNRGWIGNITWRAVVEI
jgi:hypothetical protein